MTEAQADQIILLLTSIRMAVSWGVLLAFVVGAWWVVTRRGARRPQKWPWE